MKGIRQDSGLVRPERVTSWLWLHDAVDDLALWQHCLVAAAAAEASDLILAATKMYASRGGTGSLIRSVLARRKP